MADVAIVAFPPDLIARLAKLAIPFVDKEPMDVVLRAISALEGSVQSQPPENDNIDITITDYDPRQPPNLTFARVQFVQINGGRRLSLCWQHLLMKAICHIARLTDAEKSSLILCNHQIGRTSDNSFVYVEEANVSVQRQDAPDSWKSIFHIFEAIGKPIEVVFVWRKGKMRDKSGRFIYTGRSYKASAAVRSPQATGSGRRRLAGWRHV